MMIRRTKYHNDISAAYVKGLEQGFELARKLKQIRAEKRPESHSAPDMRRSEESSLLLKQLVDIAGRKGIELN